MNIIITGPTGGIGYEFAKYYAKGNNLILLGRNKKKLEKIRKELGGEIYVVDLSKKNEVKNVAKSIKKRYKSIELLINNAGIGEWGKFKDMENYEDIISVNCMAPTILTKELIEELKGGRVLFISSMVGFSPAPYFSVYGATKAYILSLALALREENIKSFVVAPGAVKTNFQKTSKSPTSIFKKAISPMEVVRKAVMGMKKNRAVIHTRFSDYLLIALSKIMPITLNTKIAKLMLK